MDLLQDNDDDSNKEEQIKQEPAEDLTSDLDIFLGDIQTSDPQQSQNSSADVELALAQAEYLMSRRPLLLNHVLLRQNLHNVREWLKRL
eukprot:7178190-Ditylum_brightwellii.AAC.1